MKKQRFFALMTAFSIVLSVLLSISVSASPSEISSVSVKFAPSSVGDSIKGSFSYPAVLLHDEGVEAYEGSADFYYSDVWFNSLSSEYNPSLATMSFSLAMTAFTEFGKTADDCYENAEQLLTDIGFSSFESNSETDYIATDKTIGVLAAKKTVIDDGKAQTLIAIALRGGGYGSEWAGNFVVGSADECDGNHNGFYDARDRALEFVCDYIKRNGSKDTKLWITGFSRSAAVAGLVGAWVDDNLRSFSSYDIAISFDDVFTYTFEAPLSTDRKNLEGKNYGNIFNIINKNDIVPLVPFGKRPMTGWDFCRPGVDVSLPAVSTEEVARLDEILKSISPYLAYDIHNFSSIVGSFGNTQSRFIENFTEKLAAKIDRETYVEKIQEPLSLIMKNLMNRSEEELYTLVLDLLGAIGSELGINQSMGVGEVIRLIGTLTASDTVIESLLGVVGRNLVRVGIIDEYTEELKECLLTFVFALFKNDESGSNLTLYAVNLGANTSTRTVGDYTISENRIISAHLPENVLGMLMFSDPNFKTPPSGYITSAAEKKDVVDVAVNLYGKTEHGAYYKGDSVRITVSTVGCLETDGFYADGKLLAEGGEYAFTAENDITLELKTAERHSITAEWIVDREPTEEIYGLRYKMCTKCGTRTETAEIPKLEKQPPEIIKPQPPAQRQFPTAAAAVLSVAAIAALSVMITLALRYRPTKKNKNLNVSNEENE